LRPVENKKIFPSPLIPPVCETTISVFSVLLLARNTVFPRVLVPLKKASCTGAWVVFPLKTLEVEKPDFLTPLIALLSSGLPFC